MNFLECVSYLLNAGFAVKAIMPPKRKPIGRSTSKARRVRASRSAETDAQREERLEGMRLRNIQCRTVETDEQREARQETNRARTVRSRASETGERREARQTTDRERTAESRASETGERRETRQAIDRERTAQSRRIVHAELKLGAFNYNADYDYSLHPSVAIGKMDKVCLHCGAMKFKSETPGMCCASGKVKLPPLRPPPEPLLSLLSGDSSESKHFLKNIRKYNSAFQMTSFGATKIVQHNFMPTFKIQGQVYHCIGSLLPVPDVEHKFLQIYFMGDDDLQIDQRCSYNQGTRREIISDLQTFFHQNNALIRLFRTAIENMPADDYKIVIRADKTPAGEHARRYNAPTINEVAIVMVGEEFDSRDIILHRRNDTIQRVAETHRSYDALQYPIIFWEGEDGYHFNIMQTNPTTGEYLHFYIYQCLHFITSNLQVLHSTKKYQQ